MSSEKANTPVGPRTHIALVGMGPRGAAVAERMVAASLRTEWAGHVSVHVIDPYLERGGAVWREDQTRVLLMNTQTWQTTLYPDESTRPRLGMGIGKAFTFDQFLASEGSTYGPHDFAPRFEHGRYVRHVFEHAEKVAYDARLTFVRHQGEAVDLRDDPQHPGKQIVAITGEDGTVAEEIAVDFAILALGHLPTEPSPRLAALRAFGDEHGLPVALPSSPIDIDYAQFLGRERIAVEGMGLNFFDAMGILTDLWGGEFVEGDGRLVYRASGKESALVVGSRTGVLYRPKPDAGGLENELVDLHVLTDSKVRDLASVPGGVEYEADLVPLIREEIAHTFRSHGFEDSADEASINQMLFPFGRRSDRLDNAHERTVEVLRDMVAQASSPVDGRWLLLFRVLRTVRRNINELVRLGALTPGSLQREWFGFGQNCFASWASGPPLVRSRQLLALADAGLVTFMGPGASVRGDGRRGRFVVAGGGCGRLSGASAALEADAFLAAHLPGVDMNAYESDLIAAMSSRGELRRACIPEPDGGDGTPTGSIDVAEDIHPLREDGTVNSRVAMLGIPVSAAQPNSAITAEPRSGAPLLRYAERAVLAALDSTGNLTLPPR